MNKRDSLCERRRGPRLRHGAARELWRVTARRNRLSHAHGFRSPNEIQLVVCARHVDAPAAAQPSILGSHGAALPRRRWRRRTFFGGGRGKFSSFLTKRGKKTSNGLLCTCEILLCIFCIHMSLSCSLIRPERHYEALICTNCPDVTVTICLLSRLLIKDIQRKRVCSCVCACLAGEQGEGLKCSVMVPH